MKTRYRDHQPDDRMLLPPSFADLLPKDHEVFFVRQTVLKADLSQIYDSYTATKGQPPYQPSMMVAILVYAYMRGVRSARKIERMLYEDIPMRYLSGNQQPDFWTIANFRKRHLEALAAFFAQTVAAAVRAHLVRLDDLAVDGTKLRANASKHRAMSYDRLEKEEQRLEAAIAKDLEAAVAEDEAEAREHPQEPPDQGGQGKERERAEQRLEHVREAKAELERRAVEREEHRQAAVRAEGKSPRPSKQGGRPRARDQYNFTDPESRVMKDGQGTIIQGYNAQAAVDPGNQIIVAATLTNVAPDVGHLPLMVAQAQWNTGRPAKRILADAGFFSEKNVKGLESQGYEVLIPPVRISHMQWRTAKAPRGRIPKSLTTKERMLRKLHTKRGKELYKRRETSVEPVFGQIKWARNLKQLSFRGLATAKASWLFECAVHNLMKMHRAGIAWA